MSNHLLKPSASKIKHNIDPQKANWNYLGYQVLALKAGDQHSFLSQNNEAAIVPLAGKATVQTAGKTFNLNRKGVFIDKPHVLYCPPKHELIFTAITDCEIAIGTAPAEGKYPLRLILPKEQKVEVRGGGPAVREVHHTLSHPLPAERLILFEVYVPGGMWSGWPPHRHDGLNNSPYLEETYHFKFNTKDGFGLHRNYDDENNFNEVFAVKDDDLVLVTKGYHPVASAPGNTMYFLNYLAGELIDNDRAIAPVDEEKHAWIKDNWDKYKCDLPLME